MFDGSHRNKKKSQINDYIRLGNILKKERSALKQKAVDAILRSKISLKEKIEKILHIDHADERYGKPESGPQDSSASLQNEKAAGETDDDEQEQVRLVKKSQYNIKRFYTEKRFLSYLFHEYAKIKHFGIRSGTLAAAFLFRVRINPDALKSIYTEFVQKKVQRILTVLKPVILTGWHILDKYEYNCIVTLIEFCQSLLNTEFHNLPCGDRLLLNRFKSMERLFLVLHSNREIMDAIFSALQKISDWEPARNEGLKETADHIQSLLSGTDDQPSLYNLIIALNMMRWRRFFIMSDLINYNVQNVIPAVVFDCPDKVRLMIRTFIDEQESKLTKLVRERTELSKELSLFPLNTKAEIDYGTLTLFYNQQADPHKAGAFHRESEQILFFLIRLVDFFIKSFRYLLSDMVAFDRSETGIIFPNALFGSEIERLNYSFKKLERHTFSFGSISRQRYLEIRKINKTATRIEAEAFSIVNEILMYIHAIARKLSAVLVPHGPQDTGSPESGVSEADAIPYGDRMIKSEGVLAGKSVNEALRYTTCIAYSIGLYMADPLVLGIIEHAQPLNEEIENILGLLQRIAPVKKYLLMQRKYALEGMRYP
jgi:hypothetical protein